MIIDPHRFRDLPLLTRATARDDYSMMIDVLVAGRIILPPATLGASRWFWTVIGSAMVQSGLAFRQAVDYWLTWALAQGEPVHWFG